MEESELRKVLSLQYTKALALLEKVITQYDEVLWYDDTAYGDPAWRIAYHALFYTNLYLAPSPDAHVPWSGENGEYRGLKGGIDSSRELPSPEKSFSREQMRQYLAHIRSRLDSYLEGFEAEKPCWPDWYDENQMEFHINNLRHLQHHAGALVERHDRIRNLPVGWQ